MPRARERPFPTAGKGGRGRKAAIPRILLASLLLSGACADESKSAALPLPAAIQPDARWTAQAAVDAKEDRTTVPNDGATPNKMVCERRCTNCRTVRGFRSSSPA